MTALLAELLGLDDAGWSWRERALCAQIDGDFWFPESGRTSQAREAKRICGGCPVKAPCLEFALAHGEREGVWGATMPQERRRLRRSGAVAA